MCVFSFCLRQQFVWCKQKNWVLSIGNYNNHNISTKTCFMGNLCCEVGMNENRGGGVRKSRNPGPRDPAHCLRIALLVSCCAAAGQALCVYSYPCCHILVCTLCTRCQVVSIHPTSLKHSQWLKNWQSGTHNQQRQSLLFPAEEEAERRLAEDTENSLTPSFTTATTTTTPLACGVWVFMYGEGVRVDSWCLCLHLRSRGFGEAKR